MRPIFGQSSNFFSAFHLPPFIIFKNLPTRLSHPIHLESREYVTGIWCSGQYSVIIAFGCQPSSTIPYILKSCQKILIHRIESWAVAGDGVGDFVSSIWFGLENDMLTLCYMITNTNIISMRVLPVALIEVIICQLPYL